MIRADEYVDFLRREYLTDYIRGGGSAVKFAVPLEEGSGDELRELLATAANDEGFFVASIDATTTKVHMIDQLFHEIARQVDWQSRAEVFTRRAIGELGFKVPPQGEPLALERLAELNRYSHAELRVELYRKLHDTIQNDYGMAREFRIAMLRLCQAQIETSDAAAGARDAVLAWLRGELRLISAVKPYLIFQKIARHNAVDMLLSLTRWLPQTGLSGLVLDLDIRRCALTKRPDDDRVFYTKTAVLNVYELLRQLIDATDTLSSCLVFVTTAPETLTDSKRGIEDNYYALKLRIWDEVRDRRRTNPFSALVRVSRDAEALIVHR
jgi:BREX system ATP-binding protein BrxC/D